MYELDSSLKKIARGASVTLIGMTLGFLFSFVVRLIIARYGSPADYGIFSLALAVLNIIAMLSAMGLQQGATRYIAYFRGKDDSAKVKSTISASIKLSAVASIVLSLVVFLTADLLASKLFHTPEMVIPLKIFAVCIPFFTLIQVLAAVFRGFDRVEPMVLSQYLIPNFLFIGFLLLIIAVGLPITNVYYAYLAALIIAFSALVFYTARSLPRHIGISVAADTKPITRELLLFSLPLMIVVTLNTVTTWADTLVLGHFKTPEVVGLYNAAKPMTQLLSAPLFALGVIYVPVATGFFSRSQIAQLRTTYAISTRWVMFITLPVFLVLFLFPEAVLNLLFGAVYVPAAAALRILSLGFIISNLLGPNGTTLLAAGHTRFLMWATLVSTILNIALNILLVPPLGIAGAAIALIASLTFINIINSARLYQLYRAQPFSKNLLKPAIICMILAFAIQALAHHFLNITWWLLVLLFIVYICIYGLAALFTRSFDKEDIALLLEIEKRSGINAASLKRVLKRFV
ncbi:MAG: oligosaccharide flippase family protein [Chloroflexota bacterium]|nr:MAG: oligosaccharide flippase family protein [Chloroflexota bacterium]